MHILSIQSIANIARDLAKNGTEMKVAIHYVAEEYDTDPHLIACELSRRGCTAKKKKAIAKKLALEAEHARDFEDWKQQEYVLDASRHEMNIRRGFIVAGHLSDY